MLCWPEPTSLAWRSSRLVLWFFSFQEFVGAKSDKLLNAMAFEPGNGKKRKTLGILLQAVVFIYKYL